MERKTLLLLAILAGAQAGPLNKVSLFEDDKQCSSTCPETSKFNYQTGTTYEFSYDSSAITALTGASEEVSGLHITATADVEVLDRCEFALKLRDVRLEEVDPTNPERRLGAPGSTDFRRMLESDTLRFSFQDGKVVKVCPTDSENWQALNVKRGVLSAFQNTMDKLSEDKKTTETDIAGNCEAEYKVNSNAWGQIKISKSKKILGCTDRHGKKSAMQTMPYRVPSTIQSMPLMKSSHNCDQTFHTDGRLIESTCEEVHTFRPFSYGKSGATTTAKQTLKYKTYKRGVSTRQSNVGRRTDLLFEHAYDGERLERDYRDVVSQLREICSVAKEDVRPEVPRMFANLVYKMRRLDTNSLGNVWRMVGDDRRPFCDKTEVARKYFLDAIPNCGTIASVSLIQKMVSRDDLNPAMAAQWLNSLAFISKPSQQMLADVKPLVTVAKPSRQAMLAVSALVNTYCKVNSECERDSEVQALVKIFEDNLGYDCKITNKDQREKILMSLKALGNTGRALKAVDTLGRCITNKDQATDIRVAAIQAFRRLPCSFDNSKLMSLFKDSEEDTEVRAHAYLAFMRCASSVIISEVKSVLENEKSTQIGTFVWTHLTNLMETSDPFKWAIREILEDEELSKDFNNDVRKFSRNYEKSFFSQILNAGAKVESNVLFSSKSYLPRTATFNLTVDMFGESLNLLELEGRIEGFEYFVESFFGPNGYFQQNEVNAMLNRKRRNIINDADVQKAHTKFGAHMDDVTKGSASIKVFGNEIAFGDFAGFDPLKNKDSFNPLDILIKLASDQDIDYSKSAMFLDTSMIIPTMIGLPLNLTVNGTASINMKIGGHVDIRKLMTSPHEFDIDGHIKPSGAIELSSTMTVDAFVAKSGIKMVTTVHTSTYMDGKLSMKDGEFNFDLNTPKDKMEIVDVQSKFFVIHKEQDREQKMIVGTRVEKKVCTGQSLEKLLGIQLCGELQFPNALSKTGAPFFPLTGPSKFSVILNKPDSLRGYNFQAKYQSEKVRKTGETHTKYTARLAFDTPGSRVDRKVELDYSLNIGDLSSNFELVTPWKKVSMDGAVVTRDDLKRATLRMTIDEENEYFLSAQTEKTMEGKISKFTPNIELRIPRREPITLAGSIEHQFMKHYAADLTLSKLFRHPVMFKTKFDTTLSKSLSKVIGELELRNQLFDSKVSGIFSLKPGKAMATRIELEYNRDGKPKQSFLLSKKIRNLKPGSYSLNTVTTSDAFADYNHQMAAEVNYNDKHMDFEIDLNYGDDFSNKDNQVFIKHETDFVTKMPMKVESKTKLKVPSKDILAQYDLSYNVKTMTDHQMSLTGRWNNKKLETSFNLKDESSRRLMKYTANGNLEAGKLRLSFDEKFEQTGAKAYSQDLTLGYQGDSYIMKNTYAQPEEKKHTVTSSLQIPGEREMSVSGETTLDVDDFAASGVARFRGQTYSAGATYENKNREKALTANAVISGDRYTAEGKVTELREGWSASYDVNFKGKKYSTEGKVMKQGEGWVADGKMNLYGDKYSAEGKLLKQREGWSVSSELQLPSKKYSGEGQYTFNPRLITATGSVDLEGDKYSAETRVVNEEQRKNAVVSTNLNGKVYSADLKLNKNDREMTGELKLSHPQRRIESDITISGAYPRHARGQMSLSWDAGRDDSKKMTITGDYSNNSDRSAYKHIANLRLNHPGHVASMDVNFNSNEKSTVSGQWNRERISGTGEFNLRRYSSGPMVTGEFGLTSTIKYLENLALEFKHKVRGTSYQSGGSFSWAKGKTVGGNLAMEIPSTTDIQSTLTVNTPFRKLNTLTFVWNHKLEGKTVTGKAQAKADARNYEINFSGTDKSSYRRPNYEGSINMKTPFDKLEDVTAKLTHMHDSRQIDSKVEATLASGKMVVLSINGQDRSRVGRNIQGSVSLTTPWENYRDLSASMEHSDDASTLLTTKMNAKWASDKQAEIVFNLQNRGTSSRDMEGSITVKTPFEGYTDMSLSAAHKDDLRQFDTSLSAKSERREIAGFKFNMRHYARNWRVNNNGKLDITTPFSYYRNINYVWKHRSTDASIDSEFSVQWPYRKEVSLTVNGQHNVGSRRTVTASVGLKTPFEAVKDVGFTLNHENGDRDFKLTSNVKLDARRSINVDAELENNNAKDLTASFKLTNPFIEDISSGVKVMTSSTPMTAHADFSWEPRKTVAVDGSLTLGNGFNGDLRLTTPFEKFERFMLTARHDTSAYGMYKSGATFEYAPGKKFDLSTEVNTNRKYAVNLDFKIPCPEVRTVVFNLEHSGEITDFTNKMDFESQPRLGKFTSDVSLRTGRNFEAKATVTTPFRDYNEYSASITHNNRRERMVTNANINWPHRQTVALNSDMTLKSMNDFNGVVSVSTPFTNLEMTKVNFNHKGDLSGFTCHYETEYMRGEKMSADISFSNDDEMSGSVTVNTPFRDWQRTEVSFTHKGELKNFESTANLMYGRNEKINTKLSFSGMDSRRIDMAFDLATPFKYFENIQLGYKHNGDWSRRFTCEYDIGYARGKKIQLTTAVDMRRDYSLDLTFKSPFEKFEDITANFKHAGPVDNFKTTAEVVYAPSRKINTEVSFNMLSDIEGSLKFTSPYAYYENIMASFRHSGELKKFNSHAEVTYAPRSKIEGDVSFDMTKDIMGSVNVKTPFDKVKDVSASLKHSGELKNFNTHAECTYAPSKKVEADVSFALAKEITIITGSASFKSPFENFEDISASFNHNGVLNNFRTKANVQYSPRDKADVDVSFKSNRRVITGEMSLRTPFENFRRQSASFKDKDNQFEADVVYHRNQKLEMNVKYPQWTDITATVKTPYNGFEEIGAAYKLTGDYNKKGHAEVTYQTGKKIEADMTYYYAYGRDNYRLDSSLVVKTPFRGYREMGGKATYNGFPLKFVAHADVYVPSKKYELDIDNDLQQELNKKTIITVKTPHENFEDLSYNMEVTGIANNFRKHTVINYYRGMSIVNDVTYKKEGDSIETTYTHQSPYWDDFTANFKYNGEPKDFTSHVDVTYAVGKTIEADVSFNMKNSISATASLKTPFENFEDMSVNIMHKGNSWRSLSTRAVVKYSPRDTISASTTFTLAETRLLANVHFTSPFRYFEQLSAEVTHDGDLSAFKSNAEVSYARGKKISASAVVKNRDIRSGSEATFTVQTPFRYYENMEVTLKSRKTGELYKSSGIFTWARGKSLNIDTTFQNSGEFLRRKDFQFDVTATNTHRRDLSLSWKLDHSHMWKRSLNTKASLSVNGNDYVDVTAVYRNARNEHRGSIELARPLPMKVDASGSVDGGKVSGELGLNWNTAARDSNVRLTLDSQGSTSQIQRDTTFKVITPRRTVIVEHKIEISAEVIEHNIVYCWDDARDKKVAHAFSMRKNSANFAMTNKLVSPWRSVKTVTTSTVSRKGVEMENTFFWNADRDNTKKLTIKGKHERFGNTMKQELVIQHPNLTPDITIQNEVNIGDANTIYSTNTEIDYSGDSRKKLTVSTNLRKEKVRFSGTNYTMQVDIRHPASSLDISAISQLGNSDRFWTAGLGLDYTMSKTRDVKSFLLRSEINKLRSEMELQLLSPIFNLYNWAKMRDLSTKRYKNVHVEMKNTYNDNTVSSSMDIDQRQRLVDLKVNYDPENPLNLLHAYAKFNNDSAVTAEVYRMHNNKKITEGLVTARLNNSRLMHTRVHWRPTALLDMKDGYNVVKRQMQPQGTMMADMADEASNRWRRTVYMVNNDVEKITQKLALNEEMRALDDDWNRFTGEMGNMLRRNEFYTRDMLNAGIKVHAAAKAKLAELEITLSEMARSFDAYIKNAGRVILYHMANFQIRAAYEMAELTRKVEIKYNEWKSCATEYIKEMKDKAALLLEETIVKASEFIEPYLIKYMEYYNIAMEKYSAYMAKVNAKYEELMAKVRAHPYYKKAMEKVDRLLEKYDSVINHDYAQYLPEMPAMPEIDYSAYYNNAQDYVNEKAQQYTSAIYGAHGKLKGQIQEFIQRSEIQALKKYANLAVDHGKWAYENYEIERHAKDIAKSIYDEVSDYVQDNAKYIAKEYLRLDDTRVTVWNPQQGEVQAEMGLPVAWESFVELPKYEKLMDEVKMLRKKLRLPKMDMNYAMANLDQNALMDYFYEYKPTRDFKNWIPPFKAHATIAGQHISTFDHRHYEFQGTCSYILAHDFIDGNFTVLVDYHAKRGKSLIVHTNDKEVQLLPDFTVRLNGKKIDMPVQFGNTTIMRIGNAIRVHNTNGVTVTCDNIHDVCTTNMTGWYYGKTAGLFGTYDNEPSNDFMTMKKSQADDTLEFTRSWSLRCRGHRNNANIDTPDKTTATHTTCAALFEDESSVLRPCYKIVNPAKYYSMCYNDLASSKKNADDETLSCNVAANYIKECSLYDVYLRLPRSCVRCETGDKKKKTVIEGEEFTISNDAIKPPKSADVVLVVEEKSCNKKTAKRLQDIVKNMEVSLRKRGMKNNMFGLVAFGGEGVHDYEHSHTMDGKLFNTFRLFKMGVSTLDFSTDGSNSDVLRAVRMASLYPFRAGVAKVVVVIPCSSCEEEAVNYSEIQQLLIENAIEMHLIAENDFTVKGKKSYNYYGIDAGKVYTNKDYKKFNGESSLRKHISVPKDLCVALAHETNGSVFNLNVITKTRANILKKMIAVFAKRVAATAEPNACQVCQCVADELGVGKSICRSCEMPSFTSYFSKIMRNKIEESGSGEESGSEPRETRVESPKLKKKTRRARE